MFDLIYKSVSFAVTVTKIDHFTCIKFLNRFKYSPSFQFFLS